MSLNGGPISWKAARQGGVTLSSSEAEFVAASQAGKEILYLRALLKGLACPQTQPTQLWEDNASCILMSENPTNSERSRHVDVRVHFLRDMVRDGAVKLIKCAGTQNVADVDQELTQACRVVCLESPPSQGLPNFGEFKELMLTKLASQKPLTRIMKTHGHTSLARTGTS